MEEFVMPKKQAVAKETVAAAPARAAKPKTPRVKAAQHSKVASTEPVAVRSSQPENAHETIAQMAYSYWECRGCEGGNPVEDWLRAEHEYRQRLA
jgi:hypothetical protein